MENIEIKSTIENSKNIYIIPSQEPAAQICALALFYTLKEFGKNVNLVLDSLPDNLSFLSPSMDYVSYPKNFVISIPTQTAQVSQIYYEKNEESLKIHLSVDGGIAKKENISFYYTQSKPDLIVTVGIKDYVKQLSGKLDSFGFLLDSPILNIDSTKNQVEENKNFGKINLLQEKSLAEIILEIIEAQDYKNFKKEVSDCLMAGIVMHTDNFRNQNISAEIFEASGKLMKNGADLRNIAENIYK